ncbi:ester cyclase [Methanosarcina hadiensis]|uniref:ester cyclase n=1 Tax=Methanosarcina hadiensis TaxID=3078083 RepID=UPI003977636F
MTKTEINQKIVDAINRHNSREAAEYYAEDAVVYDPMYLEPLRGREAIEKDTADTIRAIPDLRVETHNMLEKDNTIAIEYTVMGTNTGPFVSPEGDVPPTGKKVKVDIAMFSTFNDQDRVVEEHRYYNVADMTG